jgi:putative Holliday junction resolvase
MDKILGIDYGDKRTGLAVSDSLGFMASGVGTVKANGDRALVAIIIEKINELGAKKIVLGNPINMDGSHGPRSQKAEAFAEKLREATGLEVVLVDERCSTMEAYQYLNATDTRGKKRKDSVDTLSAQIILQDYLDSLKNKKI